MRIAISPRLAINTLPCTKNLLKLCSILKKNELFSNSNAVFSRGNKKKSENIILVIFLFYSTFSKLQSCK
ncbi:MAG: hypothetical protein D3924_07410 [Candidatus Electrothrix sp. AR4]|nr:hypothetical protein [Candidatus Electrothrix sp. AR4]